MGGSQRRRQTRNVKKSGGEVFEALTGLFVNGGQVKDGGESSSRKWNVVESRNSQAPSQGKSRSAEDVKYKSSNRETSRNLPKRLKNIRSVESKELEHVSHAAKSRRLGELEVREAVEGDAWGGLGDTVGVRGCGR